MTPYFLKAGQNSLNLIMKIYQQALLLFVMTAIIFSCNKGGSDGPVAVTSPRVGTTWTYQLDTYGAGGTSYTSNTLVYKVSNEQSLGGETWLNITDSTSTTVYLLRQKTGGLYNYANSTANLLCKDPATVNDTYSGFFSGAAESFTVKEVGTTIGGGISVLGTVFPDFTVNRYEGTQAGILKDIIWNNSNAWIVRKETYAVNLSGINNIKYRWRLLKVVY
jgi:hypothetical protein